MREILFRGKRIDNGEWAYGVPLQYSAGQIGIVKCTKETRVLPYEEDFTFHAVEELFSPKVDPATVGQYTGLTDKNGVKIFEGDLVRVPMFRTYNQVSARGTVEFRSAAFSVKWDDENYGRNFAGYLNDMEIIGNIYDNPKLLEG